MENILLVADAGKPDINTVDFACYIARLTHSRLNAVFVEPVGAEEKPVLKELYGLSYVETITAKDFPGYPEKIKSFNEHEKLLCEACTNRGVNHRIHSGRNISARDIVVESRFMDLIIINPGISFKEQEEGSPSHFVKEVLADAECPVIIAPYHFYGIDEILLTYNGSKSSVFAIKQFVHLFPELRDKKITLLQIDEKKILPLVEEDKIRSLLRSHYPDIQFRHLQGNAGDELLAYLLKKENVFVVMGAYGRGMLSSLLKPSTADLLMKTVNLPVFIAHY